MKRVIKTLCVLICILLLLYGCNGADVNVSENADVNESETSADKSPSDAESEVSEDQISEKEISVLFDSGDMDGSSPFLPSYAPFSLYDTSVFSGCVITEISFPFHSLAEGYTADSEGLYMPVYVVKSDFSSTRQQCEKILLDFTGKLDGVKSGDWLTVTDLNIAVGTDETLAFGDTDMAVLPGFLRNDGTHGFWNRIFDAKGGNNHSLVFTVKGYRTDSISVPSIDDGINAVSFIGDSITTYKDWSNNSTHNFTIGGNALWYPNNNYIGADMAVESTWWHRVATELGYTLCVNNSWSSSIVTDPQTYSVRAKNLHNTEKGFSPDAVVIYMGINDYAIGIDVGDFDGSTTPSANPKTFSEAYGRLIHTVANTYPGVEIYCCTLIPDGKRINTRDAFDKYNEAIRTVAENMGATVVDLYSESGITADNVSLYTVDKLHPNSAGMKMIADVVIDAVGKKD